MKKFLQDPMPWHALCPSLILELFWSNLGYNLVIRVFQTGLRVGTVAPVNFLSEWAICILIAIVIVQNEE